MSKVSVKDPFSTEPSQNIPGHGSCHEDHLQASEPLQCHWCTSRCTLYEVVPFLYTPTNKAVLEPRVSPAFAITYFCNHCNIRFENTSKYVDTLTLFQKIWTKGHWPLDDLWPHVCWGHMCDSTQGSLCPSPMTIHQCMWIQWSI